MTRLKYERLRRGWSQIVLAYKAKVANTDVSRWERGMGIPYPSQAQRLEKVLGVDRSELLVQVNSDVLSELTVDGRHR
jgi:ribosome-binding protein aMBF1 (putative translation factor)